MYHTTYLERQVSPQVGLGKRAEGIRSNKNKKNHPLIILRTLTVGKLDEKRGDDSCCFAGK